jgi:N-acetylglucosaminyl-diphospho-decaprenol L-rhamnosyltransferase
MALADVPRDRRLAALVVNYNSGAFAVGCVRSLIADWSRSGRPRETLDLVLVDNKSPRDQSAYLAEIEALGVRVVRSDQNLGYAGGINLAYAQTSGGAQDFVAILNPDLYFLPGSVEPLLEYLAAHPECAAVDPRATIDPGQVFNLPRNLMPTPWDVLLLNLSHRFARVGRYYAARRVRLSMAWWVEPGAVESDFLSGACIFLRRGVVQELGQPMDPRYPLYFEDTDLFRELSRRGYRLMHVNRSAVLHHWSRSSGAGDEFEAGEGARRYKISSRLFYEKHYGRPLAALVRRINGMGQRWAARGVAPIHPIASLGLVDDGPRLEFDRSRRFLVELGLTPNWLVAAAAVGEGQRWACPPEAWAWLFPGRYFLRALDRDSGEVLGAYEVFKSTPGRSEPVTPEELLSLAAGPLAARG